MITVGNFVAVSHKAQIPFYGLSTDTKPVEEFESVEILNGSTFFEMDTQEVKFYDAESQSWI